MIFCIKNILKKGNLNFICCDIGHILIGGAPCGTRTHVGRLGGNCSIQLS